MTETRRRALHVVVLIAILGAFWWNQDRGLKAVATETHAALCEFRADLERRRDSTRQYLEDHPGPVVLGNVPRQTLVQSEKNQTATLRSLESLDC